MAAGWDETTRERTHPNLILAVLALGGLAYAMLSSAVLPALPTFQHALHTSETGVTWLLTAYLLAASVGTAILGPAGRHVWQGEDAPVDARDPCVRNTLVRRVELAGGHRRGPLHPRSGGRDLPACFRDRARRVSAREGGRQHRPALGDPRRRRRRRDRAGWGDHRAPQLPLAVLASPDPNGVRCAGYMALHPRVSRAGARTCELACRELDDDRHVDRVDRDQPDHRPGAGARQRRWGCSPWASPSRAPGSPWRCAARTL